MFNRVNDDLPVWQFHQLGHGGINYDHAQMRLMRKNLFAVADRGGLIDHKIVEACDGAFEEEGVLALSPDVVKNSAFYVYFSRAERALPTLNWIVKCGGVFAPPPFFNKVPFYLVSAIALDSYNETGERLGFYPHMGLEVSSQLAQAAELTIDVPGDFVEIGVYSGSTALASLINMLNTGVSRRCWLLDTYSGLDYPVAKTSPDVIWTGTHVLEFEKTVNRIKTLTANIGHDVRVQPLEICTGDLPPEIEKIAFANIDVDIYEGILSALHKVGERMSRKGIIVLEDPTSTPALYGAYLAMEEFLKTSLGKNFLKVRTTEQYFLIRID